MVEYDAILTHKALHELEDLKIKLEIAVKGLKDIKRHLVYMGGPAVLNSGAYALINNCLKDLGVE